ncbi:MAG: ABC transporter ATP-binding protein [Meiothermus sp.]|uniref:ABC transporter ATP-binding protein n=1 Tax=Meiothermus sp. TaxID=1955249 RepID=UPI0025EF375A|nr:ABC transporter ATP-binding protein [Meiothermus sp.]MCS7193593.1 ABC transporter ATP-binding protein [Meiothermus sp.]
MVPVVEMRGVTKVYRSGTGARTVEVRALAGVDLTVQKGEFVALMGPSGSGKSTLMHIIGLLDTPTEGEYRLGGTSVRGLSEAQLARIRNRRIGFVFQAFFLLPRLTALQNVALPLVYRGLPPALRLERARRTLEAVGLGDRLDHLPAELSGGQKQRVAIARALVQEPDLLLADEPTGNLDSRSSEEILALFRALHQEGKTILLVTHEPDVAARAQRIVRLRDGRVVEGGAP